MADKKEPLLGENPEDIRAGLENEIEAAFDEGILEKGINEVFPNGGKSGKSKKEAVQTCIGEIKLDLLEIFKKEGGKNLTEVIKKHLADVANQSFRAQKDISNQQAVDLVKVITSSLRVIEKNQDSINEDRIKGANDAGTGEKNSGAISVDVPVEKITKPETEEIIHYKFETGIKEKYLEGKSGKEKTEAEERLVKCEKEIGVKLNEAQNAGDKVDRNQVILSVIGRVKSLRAIFEDSLKGREEDQGAENKEDKKEDEKDNEEPAPENEKKSPELGDYLKALENLKKNRQEQIKKNGKIERIKLNPKNFDIFDPEKIKLAYEELDKANVEIGARKPIGKKGQRGLESMGEKMTLAEFQEEFGKFKKNHYSDSGVRLNIQKYDTKSGMATVFIGEDDAGKEEVSVERLRELLIEHKNAERKREPERKKRSGNEKKFFKDIFEEVIGLEKKARVGIKEALENDNLADADLSEFLVDASKLDLAGLNKSDEKKAKDLIKGKNEKIVEYYKKAEIAQKNQRYWEGFAVNKKKLIDKIKNKNIADIESIDFNKMSKEGKTIEMAGSYGIKLNGVLDKGKKIADKIRKDVEGYVRSANDEISRKLEAKRAEMKKYLAENQDEIKGRKMDEMDNQLWGQGKKVFQEVALKVSIELDSALEKIGYWEGFSEGEKNQVLREKIESFLAAKISEKYGVSDNEAKKRADEIIGKTIKADGSQKANEKSTDSVGEEKWKKTATVIFEKYGKEIDQKVIGFESGPADAAAKPILTNEEPESLRVDNKIEAEEAREETGDDSNGDESEKTETRDEGTTDENIEEVKIPEQPQETVEKREEKLSEPEVAQEREKAPIEEQKPAKEKEIDPEKEERLQAFIAAYVSGGLKYKKLVESERVKKIEAVSEQEKQGKIRAMVEELTVKTLDVLSRYSKEDREYIKKRVLKEIFG